MHDTLHDASAPVPAIYTATRPFDARRVGAAAVYCSDGRYGEQMDQFLHEGSGCRATTASPSPAAPRALPATRCSNARRWNVSSLPDRGAAR